MLVGQRQHIEVDVVFRIAIGDRPQGIRIDLAIAELDFFGNTVNAVIGRDERSPFRRDEPAMHHAAGLSDFRGNRDVDIALGRKQGHHRLGIAGNGIAREHLQVVDRRPRALGDPGQ